MNDAGSMWDYIVVGAGSAGCVVAARLAEDPSRRVLLLDAGRTSRSLWLRAPGGVRRLVGDPRFDWCYRSEPDDSCLARPILWSAGRVVGGGSAINGMVYHRGLARDYDAWAAEGCDGWAAADVLPIFQRLENVAPELLSQNPAAHRGTQGPLYVEFNRYRSPVVEPFLAACRSAGVAAVTDVNNFRTMGVGRAQASTRDGWRQDTHTSFLSAVPANLTLLTDSTATRLRFADRHCVGVEFIRDGHAQLARAAGEVIVCAGTFGSPRLLMHSGIGPRSVLQAFEIPPVVELPGVGENLQDHAGVGISLSVRAQTLTTRDQAPIGMLGHGLQWLTQGTGPAAGATMLVCGHARSDPTLEEPDLYLQLAGFGLDATPGGPLQFTADAALTTFCSVARPATRGRLTLASKNPFKPLRGELRLLGHIDDCRRLVQGLRLVRNIHSAPALAAVATGERLPGSAVQSDEELLDFARRHAGSQYHAVGTCRMGRDARAVVDPQLRVHGVSGLRVADASILPRLTSANTNAPVMMIAEKAAAMISKRDAAVPPLINTPDPVSARRVS